MLKREWGAQSNGKLGSCAGSEESALGQNTHDDDDDDDDDDVL